MKTYVYIDVSNIRGACARSLGFNIDFVKFFRYLKKKYPELQDVRYYEGIANNDIKKQKHFSFLTEEVGYTVCSLSRKSYKEPPKYANFKCQNCGVSNTVQVLPSSTKLKSNVDVYLASDMIECVADDDDAAHIILVSCDGDYAEAIKTMLKINPRIFITIMATPVTKRNNSVSSRLRELCRGENYSRVTMMNIDTIRTKISQ